MRFDGVRFHSFSRLTIWKRSALGLAVLAVVAASQTPTANAESATADPVALVGETRGASLEGSRLDVLVWPRDDIETLVLVGQGVSAHRLPGSAVTVDGSTFTVRIGAEDIPLTHIEDGRIHLDVVVVKPGKGVAGSLSRSVTLITDSAGDPKWVDASSGVAQGDTTVDVEPGLEPPRGDVYLDGLDDSVPPQLLSTSSCPYWKLEYTSDRPAKIGHTFVPDGTDSTGWAYHSYSRSHTLGVAIKSGGNAWQKSSSSKTFTSGVTFEWARNSVIARAYRVETEYGRYRYQVEDISGCWQYDYWKWSPRRNTGGYSTQTWTDQPTWGRDNCVEVSAGTWTRHSGNGWDFYLSAGVEISDIVGFDLSSRRAYASNAYIAYFLMAGSPKKLCGSNDVPAYARDIRMAKTW